MDRTVGFNDSFVAAFGGGESLGSTGHQADLNILAYTFDTGDGENIDSACRIADNGGTSVVRDIETVSARQFHPVTVLSCLDRIDIEGQTFDSGGFMGNADRFRLEGEFPTVGKCYDTAAGGFKGDSGSILIHRDKAAVRIHPDKHAVSQGEDTSAIRQITNGGSFRHGYKRMKVGRLRLFDLLNILPGAFRVSFQYA